MYTVHKMKWYNSISAKIIFCVAGMILVVNSALAYGYLRIQQEDLDVTVLRNASQLSETIKKSIRNDMFENRKEAAYKIMNTVGRQEGIEYIIVMAFLAAFIYFSRYLAYRPAAEKPVLQDGGLPVEGLARILGGDRWDELARTNLLTEGE